ncbi:MAG TPA: hypothetical protein VFV50_17915, partial [Bdellovibrionales bacterium]|nr:hypothetical protein [Bdellovibrionales bacterium]
MWRNRATNWRVAFWLFLSVLVTLTVATVSYFSLERVIRSKDKVVYDYSRRLLAVEAMGRAFEEKVAHSRAFIITADRSTLPELRSARQRFLRHLGSLKQAVS